MFKLLNRQLSIVNQCRKGFSLVELLVVISIIAVLIGFLMANFVGVRQRGRDAQRKSDLRQMQSALEMYRSDNGSYPTSSPFTTCGSTWISGGNTYMQKVPCDPSTVTAYTYSTLDSGLTYSIVACLENQNDTEKDSSNGSCAVAAYKVTQP